jgi:hypothetical protein
MCGLDKTENIFIENEDQNSNSGPQSDTMLNYHLSHLTMSITEPTVTCESEYS